MNLQIEKLIVWSKDGNKRNEVNFKLDCVNVLSGESRTGKSAVSSIIDYCLGSHDCNIPIGRVRDCVSWFGIVVRLEGRRLLLARRNPLEQNCTDESVIKELEENEAIPSAIAEHTHSRSDVKELLGEACGISDVVRGDFGQANGRLSFRDTTHLLFQVQDIIANRYMLFYKMQKAEVLERFKNWFNFIIGAEKLADVENRKALDDVRRQLKQLQGEQEKLSRKMITWYAKLRATLMQAKNFGFLEATEIPEGNADLLKMAQKLIKQRDALMKSIRMDDSLSEDIRKLQTEIAELSPKVDELDNEVSAFHDLEEAIENQGSSTRMLRDRLSIAKWLQDNAKTERGICPVCGESGHTEASAEIQKIISVVKSCEQALQGRDTFSAATLREMNEKKKARKEAHERLDSLNEQLAEATMLRQEMSNDIVERSNQAAAMFNTLQMILELNTKEHAVDSDGRLTELKRLEEELRGKIDEDAIRQDEEKYLSQIGDITLKRLRSLDCEEKYRQHPPVFKKADMNIAVRVAEGGNVKEYALDQVGSASNWVALHIAVTCAFQEFFAAMTNPVSCVPNFMVYDQPSQVYFPSDKLVRNDGDESVVDNFELRDTDRVAVRKMFETLAASINETKRDRGHIWQAIVLEHAGEDVYGDIAGVNVITPLWRNGNALIPHDWYEGAAE